MTSPFKRKRISTQAEFNNLTAFGRDLAEANPAALPELVKMFLRPLQAEMLIDPAKKGRGRGAPSIDERNFFWEGQSRFFDQLPRTGRHTKKIEIRLSQDTILPWPWERERLIRALALIGTGKTLGKWKQDHMNHVVHVWLPWGIPFVGGGNHSIAAGILAGEGKITPTEVRNMSGIFKIVECNGMDYIDRRDGSKIAPVIDPKIAAIFEIGRLMHKMKVSAW